MLGALPVQERRGKIRKGPGRGDHGPGLQPVLGGRTGQSGRAENARPLLANELVDLANGQVYLMDGLLLGSVSALMVKRRGYFQMED